MTYHLIRAGPPRRTPGDGLTRRLRSSSRGDDLDATRYPPVVGAEEADA